MVPLPATACLSGGPNVSDSANPPGSAFVMGGTGGLGRAICTALAGQGRRVFFTYRSDPAAAEALAAQLGEGAAGFAWADATDPDSIAAAAAAARDRVGPPQAAVFAAGVHIAQPFVHQITPHEWERVITVELLGLTRFVAALLPALRETRGCFVCLTSIATISYPPGDALSAVPKAGMEMLTRPGRSAR